MGKKKNRKKDGKKKGQDDLASLRKDIDRVDRDLHKLIRERAKLVEKVGRRKGSTDAPVHQPAREAQVLRALIKRHKGDFPAPALAQIWREVMGASVQMQQDYVLAVPDRAGDWLEMLARAHFGAAARVVESSNPVSAVMSGRASAAILPRAGSGGASLWWRKLTELEGDDIAVRWRLPFVGADQAAREAMVVGHALSRKSGDDLTWLALAVAGDATGKAKPVARSGRMRLLELDGYITPPEAPAALEAAGVKADGPVHWLGAFPRPLTTAEKTADS